MYPPNLNVPLPDPSQLAPQQTLQEPSGIEKAIPLIASLFSMGQSLGGSPQAGAAFLHGAHSTLQKQDQQRQVQAHQQQQLAMQQEQLQATEQYRLQQEQAKQDAIKQKLVMDTAAAVRGKTREEYEQIIGQQESIGAMFLGMRPNTIRAAVPWMAPNANTVMADASKKFLANPANAQAIADGKLDGFVMVDVQGDGKPIKVPVKDVLAAGGVQLDPGTNAPLVLPKNKPGGVQIDDEVFLGEVAKFEAEKGRKATQEERGAIAAKVRYKPNAPAISVNLGGGTVTDQIQKAAQSILEHRMAPSQAAALYGGMGKDAGAFKRAMIAKVEEIDPTFNFQEAESGYQFGKSTGTQNTVRFLDNITKTLPRLRAASADMKRGGVRMINAALLAGKRQFGNTQVATFDTARLVLADEIAKVLQGGGTGSGTSDAKLKQASDLLRGDMSIGQFDATLNEVEELLATRRVTLTKGTYMGGQDTTDAGAEVWVRDATGKLVKKGGGNVP